MESENKKVISYDQAKNEITAWLDEKKVSQKKREALASMTDNLIDAVQDGILVRNNDNTLTQRLVFGNEDSSFNQLTYKARISAADLQPHKRIVKGDSFDDNILRTILALTGQPIGIINGLDTSTDKPLADSIAVFFM